MDYAHPVGPQYLRTDEIWRASPTDRGDLIASADRTITRPRREGICRSTLRTDDSAGRDLQPDQTHAGNRWCPRKAGRSCPQMGRGRHQSRAQTKVTAFRHLAASFVNTQTGNLKLTPRLLGIRI